MRYTIGMRIVAFSITFSTVTLFTVGALFAPFFLSSMEVFAQSNAVSQEDTGQTNAVDEEVVPLSEKEAHLKESIPVSEFSVAPVVANEKAKPRDIIKKELLVTNNTDQRIDLYITVENVDPFGGVQAFESPSVSDLSTSLANWVEITRGVIELSAGESRKIPYLIHVNLSAKPGSYYARIQFSKGPKREEAQAGGEGSALMLNVEVYDDAKERLQLGTFMSDSSVVLGNNVSFSYMLENVGNRLIEPRGSIRIFNRRGEEVGSIPLNADGEEILPSNKRQLASAWSTAGRFGKYKAFLDLEYGEQQLASVQDTVYFWVFPWKEIFASLLGVAVLAVIGTYIVHMRAMAQPAHARQHRTPQTTVSDENSSTVRQLSPTPPRRARGNTHINLTPKKNSESVPMSAPTQPTVVKSAGSRVDLRSRKGNTKVHGSVIQLSSRE